MSGFVAIILICQVSVPSPQCNEANALEVRSTHVESEMRCARGWQEVIAREVHNRASGTRTYLKTICRRDKPGR